MWKTNKWVPEWVIRHAIAHLHGPSIRAGVRSTGAEHLNREPPPTTTPPPRHGELQVEADQNSQALH